MRYGSVCSGIEAATVAWHPLGWKPQFFSEIEPFPCSVLAHHYPDVPNFGDMTKFKEWPDAAIDVLVGGTPCQSFSVAGLRKGLDDPRGNLMLTYIALANRNRPKWVVWENVPGVLSSNGGADFACLLRGLEECGYGVAYRVLDAQYFGVAQRRRRVFVVGCLGSWQRAAAVLFEQYSLCGNIAPSRKTGEEVAPTIRAGAANGGPGHGARSGDSKDELIVPVSFTPSSFGQYQEGIGTLRKEGGDLGGSEGLILQLLAGCLSVGGKGSGPATQQDAEKGTLVVSQYGPIAGSLTARHDSSPCADRGQTVVAIQDGRGIDKAQNGKGWDDSGKAYTLDRAGCQAVAFVQNTRDEVRPMNGDGSIVGALAAEPGAKQQCYVALAVSLRGRDGGTTAELGSEIQNCMGTGGGGGNKPHILNNMQVRRLTPIECERLQGFPDNYTLIPHRGKPAVDGPRYKALGNSMAVPCMKWIGERIQMVTDLAATSME